VAVGPISTLESNKKRNKSNIEHPLESYKEWDLPIYRDEFVNPHLMESGSKKKKKKSYEAMVKFELRLSSRFQQGQAGWDECIVEPSPKSVPQVLTPILSKKCTPRRIIRKLCKRFWNARKWGVISCIRRKNFFHKSFWERKLQDRGATMHIINGAVDVLLTKYGMLEPVRIWFSDGGTECGIRLVLQAKDIAMDRTHSLQNPNYVVPAPRPITPISPSSILASNLPSSVVGAPQAATVLCTLLADTQFQSVIVEKPRILNLLCQSLGLAGHEEAFLAHSGAATTTTTTIANDEESRKRSRESIGNGDMEPHQKRLNAEAYRGDEIEEEEIREDVQANKRGEDGQAHLFVESCRVSNDGQEWYVIADDKNPTTKREMTMEGIITMESTNTRLVYYDAILAFKRELAKRTNGV